MWSVCSLAVFCKHIESFVVSFSHAGLWFWPFASKGEYVFVIEVSSWNSKFRWKSGMKPTFFTLPLYVLYYEMDFELIVKLKWTAWMDGTWSSSWWAIKWEVRCLQLWCNIVGACNIATAMEQFKSSSGVCLFHFVLNCSTFVSSDGSLYFRSYFLVFQSSLGNKPSPVPVLRRF